MPGRAHTLHRDDPRLPIPERALELDGFREWVTDDGFPEHVRVAWVAGEVFIRMNADSIQSHLMLKNAITFAITQIVWEEELGEVYPEGGLLTNPSAGFSTEPDLFFVSFETSRSGRVRLTPRKTRPGEFIEVVGTPDLVVEVVSDFSRRKDLVLLREAYRRAGIPEYWTVDARGDEIRFEILRLDADRYVAAAPAGSPQPSAVLGRTFVLGRRMNPVGRWHYRLEVVGGR